MSEGKGVGLKGWLSGPGAKKVKTESPIPLDRHRIAVLPLSNISPDSKDEYFANGISDELISTIAKIQGLHVIARTSSSKYKGSGKGISEIGRELRTGSIVEGTVRKAGDKLRITAQLVDAESEESLWSETYERQLDDVFGIQTDIAREVAAALRVKLLTSSKTDLGKSPTSNVEAYSLYLKGRYYWNERSPDALNKAIAYFEAAVKKDPQFALSYAGLADSYLILHHYRNANVEGGRAKAKEYVTKALSIDDRLSEPHATLGFFMQMDDPTGAEAEFRRAIRLNPSYSNAHLWYAHLLLYTGRIAEALAEIRTGLDVDPLSPILNVNLAGCLYYTRDFQGALKQHERIEEISPGYTYNALHPAFFSLFRPLCRLGRVEEALRKVEEFSRTGNPMHVKVARAYVLSYSDKENAQRLISQIQKEDVDWIASSYYLALASFVLGDHDTGFALLNQAVDRKEDDIFVKVDLELDHVRSDPRFLSLIKKLGLGN